MQRLADEVLDNAIEVLTVSSECCGGFDDPFEEVKFRFLKELKQYRDLGLEPSQLVEIDRLYQAKCEEVVKLQEELKTQRSLHDFWLNSADDARTKLDIANDKIREYQQKIADGRMVELPCKVGDTVYTIDICFWDKREKCIGCTYFHEGSAVFRDNDDCNYSEIKGGRNKDCLCISESKASLEWVVRNLNEFGKTIFLTQEEAEQALKESNRNQNENPCINSGCDCYNSEVNGCEMPSEDLMQSCPLERGDK